MTVSYTVWAYSLTGAGDRFHFRGLAEGAASRHRENGTATVRALPENCRPRLFQ